MHDEQTEDSLTRSGFVIFPVDLLTQCAERKGFLFVYSWLWHYAGQKDTAFPSAARLARDCQMKRDDVFAALAWLAEGGWIRKEARQGQTTMYHVRTEHPSPKRGTPPKRGTSPKKGVPPVPQMGGATRPPNGGHKQEPINKKELTRDRGETEAGDGKAAKAESDPYSRKTLPGNAIPNDLLDLQELLPEWWGVKKGVRSAKVFMRVCNKLRSWAQEQRRSALESAIAGGWADIYPPKTLSAPSGRPRNPDGTLMTECDIAIAQHAAYDAAKDQFLREHPDADSKDLPPSWLAFR